MRISFLQNEEFETPAYLITWASLNLHETRIHNIYNGDALPHVDDFDLLIMMGGKGSVNDPLPNHLELQELIVEAQMNEKIIIGICLGAQFIAKVFGAKIKSMGRKEIGFFNVEINNTDPYFEMFPENFLTAHWHGEYFEIPKGAKSIGSSIACSNQIFRIGNKIFAFQCHPEMTKESLSIMIKNLKDQIEEDKYVQNPKEMLELADKTCENMNSVFGKFMDNIVELNVVN